MTIDFVTNLPSNKKQESSKSFNTILVIVNKYIKALEYISYRKDLDVLDFTKLLINNICNRFGAPGVWFLDR